MTLETYLQVNQTGIVDIHITARNFLITLITFLISFYAIN